MAWTTTCTQEGMGGPSVVLHSLRRGALGVLGTAACLVLSADSRWTVTWDELGQIIHLADGYRQLPADVGCLIWDARTDCDVVGYAAGYMLRPVYRSLMTLEES